MIRSVFHQRARRALSRTEIFMAAFARIHLVMLSGVACSILAACGADGVASPGEGVIVIPAPTPTPTPTPPPHPPPPRHTPPPDPTQQPQPPITSPHTHCHIPLDK